MPTRRPKRAIDAPLAVAIAVAVLALAGAGILLWRDRGRPPESGLPRLIEHAAPEIRRWILLDVRAGAGCGAVRFEPMFRNYVRDPLPLPPGLSTADEANAFLGRAQHAIPFLPTYAAEAPSASGRAGPYHAMWLQTTAVAPQVFMFGFAASGPPGPDCRLEVRGSWALIEPAPRGDPRPLRQGVSRWGEVAAVRDQRPVLMMVAGAEGPGLGLHRPTDAEIAEWARLVPGGVGPTYVPRPATAPEPGASSPR